MDRICYIQLGFYWIDTGMSQYYVNFSCSHFIYSIFFNQGVVSSFILKDPDMIFVIETVQVLVTQFGAVCLIYAPKLLIISNQKTELELNSGKSSGKTEDNNLDV
jgi:hypothetical protein